MATHRGGEVTDDRARVIRPFRESLKISLRSDPSHTAVGILHIQCPGPVPDYLRVFDAREEDVFSQDGLDWPGGIGIILVGRRLFCFSRFHDWIYFVD